VRSDVEKRTTAHATSFSTVSAKSGLSGIKKATEVALEVFIANYFLRLIPARPSNAEPNSQAAPGIGTGEG
jgi:hypothetical protein